MTWGDGYLWGAVPLLLPRSAHPHEVATPVVLTHGLAGAYGFRRAAARQLGQVLYASSLAYRNSDTAPLDSTSLVGVAQVEGYVPALATHLGCAVTWYSTGSGLTDVSCRLSTSVDTGSTFTTEVDLSDSVDAVHVTQAALELVDTSLDDDVVATVDLALATTEDTPASVPAWPVAITVWWEARE